MFKARRFVGGLLSLCIMASMAGSFHTIAAPKTDKVQKELEKQRSKVYKNLIKDYKKQNWNLLNNNTTMEVAVLEHLNKLNDPSNNFGTITGEVSKCKSMNAGRMSAVNNARNLLASTLQGQIEGFVASLVSTNAEDLTEEQDKMIAGFTNKIKIGLSNCLQESYAIYKENADGTYHIRVFYFFDKDKCQSAVNNAVEKSLNETKMAVEMADQIRDFVNNGLMMPEE